MADFKKAYEVVKANEGGYANDPDDTGGETYKGISRNNWPKWKGWAMVDAAKKDPMGFKLAMETNSRLQFAVLEFYKVNFWDVLKLDHVKSEAIATELFDTAVNLGSDKAGEFLQMVLNGTNRNGKDYADIPEDGKIGPLTVQTLNGHKRPGEVLKLLNCLQGVHYLTICRKRPVNEKFMSSWLSRVHL